MTISDTVPAREVGQLSITFVLDIVSIRATTTASPELISHRLHLRVVGRPGHLVLESRIYDYGATDDLQRDFLLAVPFTVKFSNAGT